MLCLPFLFIFFGPLHFGFINTHTPCIRRCQPVHRIPTIWLLTTPLCHAHSWYRYCTTSSPWMTTHVPNPYDMAWHPQPPLEYEDPLHPPVFYPTYGPMDYQVWALFCQVYSYFFFLIPVYSCIYHSSQYFCVKIFSQIKNLRSYFDLLNSCRAITTASYKLFNIYPSISVGHELIAEYHSHHTSMVIISGELNESNLLKCPITINEVLKYSTWPGDSSCYSVLCAMR